MTEIHRASLANIHAYVPGDCSGEFKIYPLNGGGFRVGFDDGKYRADIDTDLDSLRKIKAVVDNALGV